MYPVIHKDLSLAAVQNNSFKQDSSFFFLTEKVLSNIVALLICLVAKEEREGARAAKVQSLMLSSICQNVVTCIYPTCWEAANVCVNGQPQA